MKHLINRINTYSTVVIRATHEHAPPFTHISCSTTTKNYTTLARVLYNCGY